MGIREKLTAFLAAQGQHDAAQRALISDTRNDWEGLADIAIRTAPEWNRTHVAHTLKLALDDPANGGAGVAEDFELRAEPHPFLSGAQPIWRAYHVTTGAYTGLLALYRDQIERRVIGSYVVRNFKYTNGETA
jgi:hypothetical protein